MQTNQVVPPLEDSELALELLVLEPRAQAQLGDAEHDSLLYVVAGSGSLAVANASSPLEAGGAALVLASEKATLDAGDEGLEVLHASAGAGADRHAPLGPREVVVAPNGGAAESATGSRSFRVLFGPHNGSTRATLFEGYVPPGKAPWHYHLYDEIVWIPAGPGRLHRGGEVTELAARSAFRLRPREVHIVENASGDRDLTVVGFFTPAGSPLAAYLA